MIWMIELGILCLNVQMAPNWERHRQKTLAVFWKRKEVQPSKDEATLAVINKFIENWKQLGSNLQKLIQKFHAEWDWAMYCCCALDKEISTLRYLSKTSACARSDVVPCHMPEYTSRLLPVWPCLADFDFQASSQTYFVAAGHHCAVLELVISDGPAQLFSFGCCGTVLLVSELCPAYFAVIWSIWIIKFD